MLVNKERRRPESSRKLENKKPGAEAGVVVDASVLWAENFERYGNASGDLIALINGARCSYLDVFFCLVGRARLPHS